MTLARHLAAIDLLRARALPEAGYHLAESAVADAVTPEEQPGEWGLDQAEAECDALALLLAARWGPPRPFALPHLLLPRSEAGEEETEEIPDPWGLLTASLPDLRLWRPDDRGPWVALGLTGSAQDGFRLVVCVTEIDPP
ncbi:hypothetical protein [Streptomyces sp. NBC_01216]|uniref:hypothetical protein n=1 Tax=unclassified Streptomyces TaxID=2593676 RepID=UPI002E167F25|nr:hypothetical protein OG393_28835 [Streptomyces sp. NBC_01216]